MSPLLIEENMSGKSGEAPSAVVGEVRIRTGVETRSVDFWMAPSRLFSGLYHESGEMCKTREPRFWGSDPDRIGTVIPCPGEKRAFAGPVRTFSFSATG